MEDFRTADRPNRKRMVSPLSRKILLRLPFLVDTYSPVDGVPHAQTEIYSVYRLRAFLPHSDTFSPPALQPPIIFQPSFSVHHSPRPIRHTCRYRNSRPTVPPISILFYLLHFVSLIFFVHISSLQYVSCSLFILFKIIKYIYAMNSYGLFIGVAKPSRSSLFIQHAYESWISYEPRQKRSPNL